MSLTTNGVWAENVWASTVWADCVWYEPHCIQAFSGGFLYDMEQVRYHVRRFKAEDEEEKEAKPILEDIAERIEQDSTVKDIEIVLRMRLRLQGLKYKSLYLKWLKTEARRKKQIIREAVAEMEAKQRRKRKRQEEEIILLFMH